MVERSANTETMQHSAGHFGEQIREAVQMLFQEKKERVAVAVAGFADAFRQAAGALDRNRQPGAAVYAEHVAARIERVSAGVRNLYVGDMVASATRFAHRHPTLFVAGAIAAGFVLGRLLNRPSRDDTFFELGARQERS